MIKQIYQNDLTPIYLVLRQNPLKEKGIEWLKIRVDNYL
jgi:hypothetical protein